MIGLTRSIALDYVAHGIRVHAVCPGCIDTPMDGSIDPAALRELPDGQPIGRMGRLEQVTAAVLWSCSVAASLVLGVALPVDGGSTTHRTCSGPGSPGAAGIPARKVRAASHPQDAARLFEAPDGDPADQARSKRSRFITLVHTAAKSCAKAS